MRTILATFVVALGVALPAESFAQPADCKPVAHSNDVIKVCIGAIEARHVSRAGQVLQHLVPVPPEQAPFIDAHTYWMGRINAGRDRGVALGLFVNGEEPSGVCTASREVGTDANMVFWAARVTFDAERNEPVLLAACKAAAAAKGAKLGRTTTRTVTVFEPL